MVDKRPGVQDGVYLLGEALIGFHWESEPMAVEVAYHDLQLLGRQTMNFGGQGRVQEALTEPSIVASYQADELPVLW